MTEPDYKIGDRVVVAVHQPGHRREGKIEKLPTEWPQLYGTCYLVRFPSGATAMLTASEINHVDVVTRLAELA